MIVHIVRSHTDPPIFEVFGSRKRAESAAVTLAQRDGHNVSSTVPWFKGGNELMTSESKPTGYYVQSYTVR